MDVRLENFLTLCETMNYRAAAEKLHITQPALTRQIQGLEQEYGAKLFRYDGRTLWKTEACSLLEAYARSARYNYLEIKSRLAAARIRRLRIGASKTIGEYLMGGPAAAYLGKPGRSVALTVDNTGQLLQELDRNRLDFLILEGIFPKERYASRLWRMEPFVGLCAGGHPFAGRCVNPEEILTENAFIREKGSGTRRILEQELEQSGYSLKSFAGYSVISSLQLIGWLVRENLGVSFAYKAVADACGTEIFTVRGWKRDHEFNIVYLPDTGAVRYIDEFLGSFGQ